MFFYNPDGLNELLSNNKMSYDEFEFAFRNLYAKDGEVWRIGRGQELEQNANYKLYIYSETIFNNFSNAIGLIYTFEKKSKIKIIICYILGIIMVPISVTMFNVFNYLEVSTIEFFTEFLYYFKKINIWYTLIFIILYLIKFLVNKKKTKEMNNILKNKKKSN